jgi:hypothetical protein
MLMTHVDLLEKILRWGLKNQMEKTDNGWAWWVNYEEVKEKEADLQRLLSEKRKRGSLPGGEEGGAIEAEKNWRE